MDLDLNFAREVLLPLAVQAYTVSCIPEICPPFDKKFNVLGNIEVDPETCRQVWAALERQSRAPEESRGLRQQFAEARARRMLAAVMADSHTFGFVATTDTDTFVCIRGTHFLSEWLEDADLPLVRYRFRSDAGFAHMGFQAIYETLQKSILELLAKAKKQPVTVLGHSLGAGLGTLCALDEKVTPAAGAAPGKVFPIASPRVGDDKFHQVFSNVLPDCKRLVNRPDIVPRVPLPIGYEHVGEATVINSGFTLDLGFAHGLCQGICAA